jgi:Asp/Glu/hydantoin racemase
MRIGVVHVTTEAVSGPYTEMIVANFDRARGPETEVLHRYVSHMRRATDTAIAYPTLLNKLDVVAEMVVLEAEGADAVLVACSGDTGVAEARSVLSIPVVAPMEAAMALACTYGWRFGIVTVADRTWASYMDQLVHTYGFASRYVGIRQLHTPTARVFTEGFATPSLVEADLRSRCDEVIGDGADTVLLGSAGLSTFGSSFHLAAVESPRVPVFDVLTVGLKFAELRAALREQMAVPEISRAGWHEYFDPENRTRVNRLFGRDPEGRQAAVAGR